MIGMKARWLVIPGKFGIFLIKVKKNYHVLRVVL